MSTLAYTSSPHLCFSPISKKLPTEEKLADPDSRHGEVFCLHGGNSAHNSVVIIVVVTSKRLEEREGTKDENFWPVFSNIQLKLLDQECCCTE